MFIDVIASFHERGEIFVLAFVAHTVKRVVFEVALENAFLEFNLEFGEIGESGIISDHFPEVAPVLGPLQQIVLGVSAQEFPENTFI